MRRPPRDRAWPRPRRPRRVDERRRVGVVLERERATAGHRRGAGEGVARV